MSENLPRGQETESTARQLLLRLPGLPPDAFDDPTTLEPLRMYFTIDSFGVGRKPLTEEQAAQLSAWVASSAAATEDEPVSPFLETFFDAIEQIEGHASETGGVARNQQLSELRAGWVRDKLVDLGRDNLPPPIGFGKRFPVIKDAGEAAENRRVDLLVRWLIPPGLLATDRTVEEENQEDCAGLVCSEWPAGKEWHLERLNLVGAEGAWALEPPEIDAAGERGKAMGEGIVIAQLDTGFTRHPALDSCLLPGITVPNMPDRGPEDREGFPGGYAGEGDEKEFMGVPRRVPSHGTGTGAVAASRGTDVTPRGIAPRALLLPIRCANSIALINESHMRQLESALREVYYFIIRGYQISVITISLGGRRFSHIWDTRLSLTLRRLERRGVIVVAAAGQSSKSLTGIDIYPGLFRSVIAVGAVDCDDQFLATGHENVGIDLSAPVVCVWRPRTLHCRGVATDGDDREFTPEEYLVGRGIGTSFAAPSVAGAAALWLAFHGRERLIDRYGRDRVAEAFRVAVRTSARVPQDGWDPDRFGDGILDCKSLLERPLPDPALVNEAWAIGDGDRLEVTDDQYRELRRVIDRGRGS